MAKRKLTDIRMIVRKNLRDEFGESTNFTWPDSELELYIDLCLEEINQVSPRKVREVLGHYCQFQSA